LHVGRRYRFDLGFVRHGVAGVGEVKVNIVWDPPWDPSRMSDEARAVLNMW
jgi:metal-sulfur cluster biosynthetic enzyme